MRPKILVVDDEEDIRMLLKDLLSLSGYDVVSAANKEEFHSMAFREHPDAIILDLILGDDEGTEVYNELIRDGLDPAIPVIFLTALAANMPPDKPHEGRRYLLRGKPFDGHALVHDLGILLEPAA
ncbi:MAG: response regulator [Candidatus Omnitrophica bacterium]|nr:response regulator [Candidatus Omnitrophota bacterium]